MTIIIMLGRRVATNWLRRQTNRVAGLISFKENLWVMIKQSLYYAKRRANKESTIIFNIIPLVESESLQSRLEWLKVVLQGTKEEEESEYKDAQDFYKPFGKLFKKNADTSEAEKTNFFRSKFLNTVKVDEAYKKGYGSISDRNIANKMLELGFLLSITWEKDFDDSDRSQNIEK
jgi:hypothetical protein